jgi:hypothetical protein
MIGKILNYAKVKASSERLLSKLLIFANENAPGIIFREKRGEENEIKRLFHSLGFK